MLSSTARLIPYSETGMFKDLVLDYLHKEPQLQHVFEHEVSFDGMAKAIQKRKSYHTNRSVLVEVLNDWYSEGANALQTENIQSLLSDKTFTICTAHQPNIFTGYLYFVYKILHVVKIAEDLKLKFPGNHFVPVFYMGSEDNDLDELGQIKVDGIKRVWQTKQTGAVGRMKVDEGLLQLISELEGQLSVLPYGSELITTLKDCYRLGCNISKATFRFVNFLFAKYGLLILVADDVRLKRTMTDVFKEDIISHKPFQLVNETGKFLVENYSMQVNPREINLFYMNGDIRERIVQAGEAFTIEKIDKSWNRDELLNELETYPDRFSPNVVLRALYQEMILPNIAFVGGGAEVSYWLELKKMMQYFNVPYPVIILRNSFLITDQNLESKIKSLGFTLHDLFLDIHQLMQKLVKMHDAFDVELVEEKSRLKEIFNQITSKNERIDKTLLEHVNAVHKRVAGMLENVEKKMLRAAKRRYQDQQRQIETYKQKLFPGSNLQERVDNILFFYSKYGPRVIDEIYNHTHSLDQQFCIITLNQ